MAGRVEFELHGVDEVSEELLTAILKSGTLSVQHATRRLEQDLEAQTRAATRGNAWRAWRSAVYPRGGRPAYDPTGEVFANGGKRSKGMLSYWSLPGTNRARGGTYLAVPLRAALGTGMGRHISPREWQARFKTKLRPLFRPGKTPLLVADGALGIGGFTKPQRAAAQRRGGQRVGRTQAIAVFALIDEQEHANRVSIGSALHRAEESLGEEFARRVSVLV